MNIDYSLFTEKAQATYRKAITTSRQCHYSLVEPQVMLVALIQEGRDMFAFMLNKLSVDKVTFCNAIQESLSLLSRSDYISSIPSADLERIFAKSIELSQSLGGRVVALEHVFWAMCVVPSTVKDIMVQFGMTESKLKDAVIEFRGGNQNIHSAQTVEEESISTLCKYAKNLVRLAESGDIEPAFGRDAEIRRVLQILSRKTKNNPVLVGEPGTGKTAIVEGLAHRILRGDVPQELKLIRLYELDLSAMVAGASAQGEFEERLKQVIAEVARTPNVVLFIDEIHTLVGAGRSSGAMDAANILKPELARGKLKVIGATTLDEYRKYIEKDKAFERRFQKVIVNEPDIESAITIMRGIKNRFENHHRIKILDEAVVSAVRLSDRYISDRFLPDKAIDLLDEAASRMRIERSSVPKELDELTRTIRNKEVELESIKQDGEVGRELAELEVEIANLREKENVLNAKWQNERNQFEQLQSYQDQIAELEAKREIAEQAQHYAEVVEIDKTINEVKASVDALMSEINETSDQLLKISLDETDIMEVVHSWMGVPISKMQEDEAQNLLHLEELLGEKVIGQKKAISAISKVIRRNRMGLNDAGKPIGSFVFLGSTGVGKTELTKALSEYLFNRRDAMVRIDMSEYQQEHSVSRLFGAPPGYVGYDQGGQLTEAVRRKPYSVVLFDEIEKAHPKVFETLLQVLDEGRMTDGQGRVVNFKNTIIIMTSNMGQEIIREYLLNSDLNDSLVQRTSDAVMDQMKRKVAPEFLNRIDDVVMFLPLTKDEIAQIVQLQLKLLKKRLLDQDIQIDFDENVTNFLTNKSYIPEFGARPVKRVIDELIVDALGMFLLNGGINKTSLIYIRYNNDSIEFSN